MNHGVNRHVLGYAGVDLAEAGGQRGKTTAGRQDKSRKVRPIGCARKCIDFNHRLNIAATRSKVQLSPRRCSYTVFDALRRPE